MSSLQTSTVNLVRHERVSGPNIRNQPGSGGALTARLAVDRKTRADAFSIRHDSYLAGGYIDCPAERAVFGRQ